MALEFGHLPTSAPAEFEAGALEKTFIAPPLSVLDTRQGYWQERRRRWLAMGIQSELGRGADLLALSPAEQARERWAMKSGEGRELVPGKGNARSDFGVYTSNEEEGAQGGTSIFDPVLCELVYRWWCPPGGAILDPFAGGSVRGIVAAVLGHPYVGVELSARQVEANRAQAARILGPEHVHPEWINGDSRELATLLPSRRQFDMVFSCPPYYDLEVYSEHPADLSAMPTYGAFLEGYRDAWAAALRRLRPNRFAAAVVTEIRDRAGLYRGFVPDTIRTIEAAGMALYNDAILVNSAGTLPLRVGKYMAAGRKLGRTHQNVLCFVKGTAEESRSWSLQRPEPPAPQLGLFGWGEEQPAAAAAPPPPTSTAEYGTCPRCAEVVHDWDCPLVGDGRPAEEPPPDAIRPGPLPLDVEPTLAEVADMEGMPQGLPEPCELHGDACPGEPQEHEPPTVVLTVVEAGQATELAIDEPIPEWLATAPEPLVQALERAALTEVTVELGPEPSAAPAADSATTSAASAPPSTPAPRKRQRRAPEPAAEVAAGPVDPPTEELWGPADPHRPCWTCGSAPTGQYRDGTPSYSCSHVENPRAAPEDTERETLWAQVLAGHEEARRR